MLVQVPSGLVAFEEVFSADSFLHFFSTNAYHLFPKAKVNRITHVKLGLRLNWLLAGRRLSHREAC